MAEQANCARRMRWNATEIVAVRQQQQDKTLPLKRPVLSAWLIQMAAAFISCLLPCGPRPQGSTRSPPRRRRRCGGRRGWHRLRHRPYRSRLEAYAKLCFLLFQCLENAAAFASEARRAPFAPSLFVYFSFPVPVLARPSSWLSRVGGVLVPCCCCCCFAIAIFKDKDMLETDLYGGLSTCGIY